VITTLLKTPCRFIDATQPLSRGNLVAIWERHVMTSAIAGVDVTGQNASVDISDWPLFNKPIFSVLRPALCCGTANGYPGICESGGVTRALSGTSCRNGREKARTRFFLSRSFVRSSPAVAACVMLYTSTTHNDDLLDTTATAAIHSRARTKLVPFLKEALADRDRTRGAVDPEADSPIDR
jgi:hypothetical protein